MLNKSIRRFGLIALLILCSKTFGADTSAVFTECLNKELESLKNICVALANREANASSNPGSGSDEETSQGSVLECMRTNKERVEKSAQRKCTDLARRQQEENLRRTEPAADPAAEPVDTNTIANTACIPGPNKVCPKKTVPLPVSRPRDLARPTTPKQNPPRPSPSPSPSPEPQKKQEPAQANKPAAKKNTPPTQADKNNRQAVDSAQRTTPQPSSNASGEANSDVQLCENSFSSANKCCGNPKACVNELSRQEQQQFAQLNAMTNQAPPTDSQGLNNYCQQMQGLGGSGGEVNSSLAGLCNSKQMSCSLVCSQLSDKYQTLLSNCNGCDSQNIYQNAYQQISGRISSCNALASRVTQISNQAIGSASSAGYGDLCSSVASSAPQSQGGAGATPASATGPVPNQGVGDDRFAQSCTADPTSPACRAINAQGAQLGSAAFGTGDPPSDKKSKSKFNLPDDNSLTEKSFFSQAVEPAAVKTGTIANNSGGGIPGGGGETSAKLGSNSRPAPSAGAPGYTTDILQGNQGEGGYSAPYQPNNSHDGQQAGSGYLPQNARAGSGGGTGRDGMLGTDLRQFLPGGSRDPQRRIAGVGRRSEINAKEEDIWRIISSKMDEKCKLGILLGCR